MAQRGAEGSNPFKGLDVEELFNTIEALSKRDTLEIGPFATLSDKIYDTETFPAKYFDYVVKRFGEASHDLCSKIAALQLQNKTPKELTDEIEDLQEAFNDKFREAVEILSGVKRQYWVFETTLELMKRLLWHLVWITESNKVAYLIPLVKYAEARDITIASVNYDNAIELCAEGNGFQTKHFYHEKMRDDFLASEGGSIRLLKLHGSIDWSEANYLPSETKPAPQICIDKEEIKNPETDFNFLPAIIFGHRNKLTAKGPYLMLLNCFAEQLNAANKLTVIGYSFRDEHLNSIICHWLNDHQDRTVRIVNGKSFSFGNIPFITDENQKFLTPRIEILRMNAGDAISQIYDSK